MGNNGKKYIIQRLSSVNIVDISTLYETVYKRKISAVQLLKKYNTTHTEIDFTGFIAYDLADNPIAFFGVTPCYIQYNHHLILAGQATDAMTLPEVRMTGLFSELSQKTYDLCEANGIKILFGFPNQTSFKVMHNKHGWQMIGAMKRFSIYVSAVPLQKICSKFSVTRRLYKNYSGWVLEKYLHPKSDFKNPILDEGFVGIFYDDSYFNYKKFTNNKLLKISGALVWINIKKSLVIGNMVVANNNFKKVITQLKQLAIKLGVTEIQFQVSPETALHKLLSSSYESLPSFKIIVKDFSSGIPLDKIKFSYSDIDIF